MRPAKKIGREAGADAVRRIKDGRQVTVTLTEAEAKALLRFDLDPPPEWVSAEVKIRTALCRQSDPQPEQCGNDDPRVPAGAPPCRYCGALPGEAHTPGCLKNPKPAEQCGGSGEGR